MANKQVFSSSRGALLPKTDTKNRAGGTAYSLSAKQGLAQYAATGCFGGTYYTSAKEQISEVLKLAHQCDNEFIAKCAVYSRQKGYMKDMPAFLLAFLSAQGEEGVKLVGRAFPKVIDNEKMLRNFVQIIRSGQVGRKSFGTALKRYIRNWLESRNDYQLFRGTVGNDPSLADVIKMVHPTPSTESRKALYGYITGRPAEGKRPNGKPELPGWSEEALPEIVRQYEHYKATKEGAPPNVPFQMLDSLGLDKAGWTQVARNARWMMTRMNVNTFQRHGVFEDEAMVDLIAQRLANPEEVRNARAFPYQLMMAYLMADTAPFKVTEALQDAMEVAIDNVPPLEGNVVICPDVSGSMRSPITGNRGAGTTKVQCYQVAALMTAAILRRNKHSAVIPFADHLYDMRINPRDSVMTIATTIGHCPGGGTYLSLPLKYLNQNGAKVDHLIYISDNESWMDSGYGWGDPSQTMREWELLKQRSPNAKMYCINIVPGRTTQAKNRQDILNIGGFSDTVFDVLKLFSESTGGEDHWVKLIDSTEV